MALQEEVRRAVAALPELERELIERIHFLGESLSDLAERSNRKLHKLEAALQRARRRLALRLSAFSSPPTGSQLQEPDNLVDPACPVCVSPKRIEIEAAIRARQPRETWRGVLAYVRRECGLPIRVPQRLISHETYHMRPQTNDNPKGER